MRQVYQVIKIRIMKILIFLFALILAKTNLYPQVENALDFDGVDDGINLNTIIFTTTNANQPYTIEAWIKAPPQGDNCIVCQYDFPGDNRFQFEIRNNKLNWWKGYASTAISILSSASITDDQWHHVAATKDGSGNVKLFIDGNQDGSGTDNLPFISYSSTIGGRVATGAGYFNGIIDEVRIWNIARTVAEIQSTMSQELTGSESGLIAYYNFNQGIAGGNNAGVTTLIDVTSNGFDGTLNGFSLTGPTSNWVGSTVPFPVELIHFSLSKERSHLDLTWATASELNNVGFEVQKSVDGNIWQQVGFVQGQGTSREITEYQYQDAEPFIGTNYYRLKQIDFDGAFTYSEVREIEYAEADPDIHLYPNPSSGTFTLRLDNPQQLPTRITLIDQMGRKVWERALPEGTSHGEQYLQIEGQGLYFLKAEIGRHVLCEPVLVMP